MRLLSAEPLGVSGSPCSPPSYEENNGHCRRDSAAPMEPRHAGVVAVGVHSARRPSRENRWFNAAVSRVGPNDFDPDRHDPFSRPGDDDLRWPALKPSGESEPHREGVVAVRAERRERDGQAILNDCQLDARLWISQRPAGARRVVARCSEAGPSHLERVCHGQLRGIRSDRSGASSLRVHRTENDASDENTDHETPRTSYRHTSTTRGASNPVPRQRPSPSHEHMFDAGSARAPNESTLFGEHPT